MPYSIETDHPDCSGWAVTKNDDGALMGCHETEEEANAQLTALNIAETEDYQRQVVLIYGPPCAGKSELAQQMAERGDLILDRDAIHSSLSNLSMHDHDPAVTAAVEASWNALLRYVPDHNGSVYIVTGAPTRNQRRELEHLTTSLRLVYADRDTCKARAKDVRPPNWDNYIDEWHDLYEPELHDRSDSMNIERRTATEGVELREEGDTLTAVGYAAVFEQTSQNLGGFVERVAPGAFRKTLQEADVRALFNHEADHLLGRKSSGTLRMMEDDKGLRYEVDLPNTTLGRDVGELLRRGDITGSSFGFRTIGDEWIETDDGYPLRRLTEVALRDVGPVTFPAYTQSEASLRSLAESRDLDLDALVQAAEADELRTILQDEPEEADIEPSSPHSTGIPRSSFIR